MKKLSFVEMKNLAKKMYLNMKVCVKNKPIKKAILKRLLLVPLNMAGSCDEGEVEHEGEDVFEGEVKIKEEGFNSYKDPDGYEDLGEDPAVYEDEYGGRMGMKEETEMKKGASHKSPNLPRAFLRALLPTWWLAVALACISCPIVDLTRCCSLPHLLLQ